MSHHVSFVLAVGSVALLATAAVGACASGCRALTHILLSSVRDSHFTSPVPIRQVEAMALPGHGDWWGARLEVPSTAAVLDFVLSDAEERSWDNNGRSDFHSAVGGALHGAALENHLARLLRVRHDSPCIAFRDMLQV